MLAYGLLLLPLVQVLVQQEASLSPQLFAVG